MYIPVTITPKKKEQYRRKTKKIVRTGLAVAGAVGIGVFAVKHKDGIKKGADFAKRVYNKSQGYKTQNAYKTAKNVIRDALRNSNRRAAVFTERGIGLNRAADRYIRRAAQTPAKFAGKTIRRAHFR